MENIKEKKGQAKDKRNKDEEFKISVTYAKSGKTFQEVFQNILLRRMDEV